MILRGFPWSYEGFRDLTRVSAILRGFPWSYEGFRDLTRVSAILRGFPWYEGFHDLTRVSMILRGFPWSYEGFRDLKLNFLLSTFLCNRFFILSQSIESKIREWIICSDVLWQILRKRNSDYKSALQTFIENCYLLPSNEHSIIIYNWMCIWTFWYRKHGIFAYFYDKMDIAY